MDYRSENARRYSRPSAPGTKQARDALSVRSRKKLVQGSNYFNFDTRREPPGLDEIDIYYGGFLDIQWGRFSASGEEVPIRNIISTLELARFAGARERLPEPRTDEEKRAVVSEIILETALWSLRSNCKTHPRVLEISEKVYGEGSLSRLARFCLRSILVEFNPDRYEIEGTTKETNPANTTSRTAD
jgi:hypothetical protein